MAASTITRDTWTNDSGTPSAPVGDGTLINNAALQNNIYARIDAMFAGAGSYATLEFGGKIQVDGFGQQVFSAGGTGSQSILIRNTTAGTTNSALVIVANDSSATLAYLQAFSSTYTTAGPSVANGAAVICEGAGGLSLAATNASGVIRFYAGGVTKTFEMDGGGATSVFATTTTTHTWATTSGSHTFQIAANTAGVGVEAILAAAADLYTVSLQMHSSSYTSSTYHIANSALLLTSGVGGVQYAAPTHTWWDIAGPNKLAIITNSLAADNGLFLVNNLHVGSLSRVGRGGGGAVNATNAINLYPGTVPVGTLTGALQVYAKDSGGGLIKLYYMDSGGTEHAL